MTSSARLPAGSYEEALAIVMHRPEIKRSLAFLDQPNATETVLNVQDGRYTGSGNDVDPPDAWTIYLYENSPERRIPCMPALFVFKKDGRVYVEGADETVLLEDYLNGLGMN